MLLIAGNLEQFWTSSVEIRDFIRGDKGLQRKSFSTHEKALSPKLTFLSRQNLGLKQERPSLLMLFGKTCQSRQQVWHGNETFTHDFGQPILGILGISSSSTFILVMLPSSADFQNPY